MNFRRYSRSFNSTVFRFFGFYCAIGASGKHQEARYSVSHERTLAAREYADEKEGLCAGDKRNRFDRDGYNSDLRDVDCASYATLRPSLFILFIPLSSNRCTVARYYIYYRHRPPPPAFSSPSLLFRLFFSSSASVFLLISYIGAPSSFSAGYRCFHHSRERPRLPHPPILSSSFPLFLPFLSSPRAPCTLPSFNYLRADW